MEPLATGDPVRIGPFRLVARLGRGGMGRVYLGRAESTGRAVAVKTIHGELLVDPEFRIRFSHEVAAARRVRDEYIAEVVDADPDGATPWLATAYVPGISVEDAVRRFGPLPAESVRMLGICVARAVAAIHAVGLVHRDLKPSNVLLTAAGPKVIDFGIARGLTEVGLTRTGMVSGSPPYMAPEQLSEGAFGHGSDVFSLAAILHYAATAAGPYGRGGAQEQYARALAVGPVLDPALPDALAGVMGHCFSADPNSRPSAADVAHSLEDYRGERPNPGWLPNAVVSDILTQATDALNTDSAAGLAAPRPQMQAQPQAQARPQAPPEPKHQPQHQRQPQHQPPTPMPAPMQAPLHQSQSQSSQSQLSQPQQYQSQPAQPRQPQSQPPPLVPPPFIPMQPQRQSHPQHQPPPPGGSRPGPQQPPRYPVLPMQGPYPYSYPQVPPKDNSMAVTALVLSLVSIIAPCLIPVALPFGYIGLSRSRKNGGSGRGQALAAIIVSSLLLTGWILLIVLVAVSSPN